MITMTELEFRDGPKLVPAWMELFLRGIVTEDYLYEEAVKIANQRQTVNVANAAQARVVREHLDRLR
jgi:hypothetical protein